MKIFPFRNLGSFLLTPFACIMTAVLWALLSLLWAWPIELLWNWLMPIFFKLQKITFWEAYGLELLCGLLFGAKMTFEHSNVDH